LLARQAQQFRPRYVVLTDPKAARQASAADLPAGTELLTGPDAVTRIAADPEADVVLSAIVGAAGLAGTWAAVQAGKTVALANKETLVVAGQLVMELAAQRGVAILPVDSEHNAIAQAMRGNQPDQVERVVLTASGGPFRGRSRHELESVTVAEALQHPTWRMGPKITIDSATMMNKALEVIEARWLFGLRPEQIEIVVHPESVVHSLVEFVDGSVIAQLSPPDMRLPIQSALTWPERLPGPTRRMNWSALRALHFDQPDRDTFEALELGYEVARRGGTTGAVLNAANESAVAAFLAGELTFLEIARVCRRILDHHDYSARPSLDELLAIDRWARQEVSRWLRTTRTSPSR